MARTPISDPEKESYAPVYPNRETDTPAGYKGSKIGKYFQFVKLSLGQYNETI